MKFFTAIKEALIEKGILPKSASDADASDAAVDVINNSVEKTDEKEPDATPPTNEPIVETQEEKEDVEEDTQEDKQALDLIVNLIASVQKEAKTASSKVDNLKKTVADLEMKVKELEEEPADTHSAAKGATTNIVETKEENLGVWESSAEYKDLKANALKMAAKKK